MNPISKFLLPPTMILSQSAVTVLFSPVCMIIFRASIFFLFACDQCVDGIVGPERSARSTFPDLTDFRIARLNGYRRVFGHVTPVFFERGIAKPDTMVIVNSFLVVHFSRARSLFGC